MSVVAAGVSPLNCRWIAWNDTLPVCTRPPGPAQRVSEAECVVCEFWNEGDVAGTVAHHAAMAHPHQPLAPNQQDPLNRDTCPLCGTTDVMLMRRDAVVQSFVCSICHQRWLATRPWPVRRDTRSHDGH